MSNSDLSAVLASTTDASALILAGAALGEPRKNPDLDGLHYTLLPDGYSVAELPALCIPKRPKGLVKLRDAASFIRYVNDHKVDRSRIYALLQPAKFLAVFDDFDVTQPDGSDIDEQADWRDFRAVFDVPASREWITWGAIDRKDLSQLVFAEFLQDNLPDVVTPDSTDLLTMILNFEATQGGKVIANQRLHDGSVTFTYQAENTGGSSVSMPEIITLKIPVFENSEPIELQARLRYRIKRDDGSITFKVELVRPHKVLEAAFRVTWAAIGHGTGLPILLGTPE
jgi:uncharacterized protein YfdQ (DUF2303 family)